MQKLALFLRERLDLIVLLSCLLITYFIWSYGVANDQTEQVEVSEISHIVQVDVTEEAENIFAFIDGVSGLYVSSEEVSDQELSNYMSATSQSHLTGGLLRINYIARVPNSEIDDKATIIPGYKEQFIVKQMVDKTGQIFESTNFNLLSEEVRREAVDLLMAGKKTVVIVVPSIQNVTEYKGRGFIFFVPVFKDGEMVGIVDALISSEKLEDTISSLLGEGYDYSWYQGDTLLGERRNIEGDNVVSEMVIIDVGADNEWKLIVSKVKGVNSLWTLVLASGVVLSFLIYIVVYALNSASLRGVEVGREMNKDLQKYKLALDSASNHIVITDADGKVLYANNAAMSLTGYSQEEIIGQTPRLWGGLMGESFYKDFWDQIKNKRKVYSGIFENKRKNGEVYLAQATVSPIVDETNELLGFVGVEEDVTDEHKIQKENAENLAKLAKFNELMVGRELKMVELKKEMSKLKGELHE